jgi:hypothetical protein
MLAKNNSNWLRYDLPERGYSVSLPDNWFVIDLKNDLVKSINDLIKYHAQSNPSITQKRDQIEEYFKDYLLKLKDQGATIYALIGEVNDEETVSLNLNISMVRTIGRIDINQEMLILKENIENKLKLSGSPFDISSVILPGGKGIEVRRFIQLPIVEGAITLTALVQFYLLDPNNGIYILTYNCSSINKIATYYPLFRAIASTFEFKNEINSNQFDNSARFI